MTDRPARSADPRPAEELAGAFARMSGVLLTEATVAGALATVTSLAADTIPGNTGSGISLLDAEGNRVTSAATDPLVGRLDDLQYELDEGPCLTAWRDRATVRSRGAADGQTWPAWLPRATELGMRSFLSAPLVNGDNGIGAMKVYSTDVDSFDDRAEDLLRRFADQAAIFVGNALTVQAAEHLSGGLKDSLRSRDLIAMARGILMVRHDIGSEDAFRMLSAESHRDRRLIHQVAADVVASPAGA